MARARVPRALEPLLEDGIVDEVVRQLRSGKEATVWVVRCGAELRCAKLYKEAAQRSFRQAVEYREGRREKNSRRARAMEKGTRFGQRERESAWRSAEVDALYRLDAAGVRVPRPFGFYDGVLLMELVTDAAGDVAPRLADLALAEPLALEYHAKLIAEVVRMLRAGVVHGDLSEFNILVDAAGPVIIDLPQAVDAAGNNHARRLFERDVDNLAAYLGQFAGGLRDSRFADEIWAHYEAGTLHEATPLTGRFEREQAAPDVEAVLLEIAEARAEAERRAALRAGDGEP